MGLAIPVNIGTGNICTKFHLNILNTFRVTVFAQQHQNQQHHQRYDNTTTFSLKFEKRDKILMS